MDTFGKYHPVTNLILFLAVTGVTMFSDNPGIIAIALISGFVHITGIKGVKSSFRLLLTLLLFVAALGVVNCLFNHRGVTVLFTLKNGNSITLEAFVYGIISGLRLIAVIIWFSYYNAIMTSDRHMCITGKLMPDTTLVITMALRYIPLYIRDLKEAVAVQKALNFRNRKQSILQRIKLYYRTFSMVTARSMEKSVITANSMNARGYGSGKRSQYSNYSYENRDLCVILLVLSGILVYMYGVLGGKLSFYYYPRIMQESTFWGQLLYHAAFLFICMIPYVIRRKERRIIHENL